MTTTVERIAIAKKTGDWNALVQSVPYLRFLGLSVESQNGKLVGRMKFRDELIGNPTIPALHGGTLGASLEAAAQFELLYRAESIVLPKTITLTIDYRRSGRPVDTFFGATIVRQGRRVATLVSHAWQEDPAKPIAAATLQMMVMAEPIS